MSDELTRRDFLQLAASRAVVSGLVCSRVCAQPGSARESFALESLPTFDGSLKYDPGSLELAAVDRGGIVHRLPIAVLYPESVDDVVRMVRYAHSKRLPVVMRGRGHSAYGQALAEHGIVIDSSTLNQVVGISGNTIEVEAGATLGTLARAAFDAGLRVPVMSGCAMLSVGGWISVGGVAGESFQQGAFIDHVVELQVVSGDGRLITCSDLQGRELFTMALAGMGQCGIIVRAKFRLTPAPEQLTYRTIDYTSLDAFLAGQQRFVANDRLHSLWATITRRDDGSWRYPVTVGRYGTFDSDPLKVLGGFSRDGVGDSVRLNYRDTVPPPSIARPSRRQVEIPGEGLTGSRRKSQPALCLYFPASVAREVLAPLLSSPQDSAGISLIECVALNSNRFRRPLFRLPRAERIFSCWILRSAIADSGPSLQSQLDVNARFLERALLLGAVRYPPFGGLTTPEDWRAHYGKSLYQRFANAKLKYDERGILTPGARIFS